MAQRALRLSLLRKRVPPSRIKVVAFLQPFQLLNHHITFIPANHCPGAAMVIFERAAGAPVLHCGDCRYERTAFQAVPALAALRGRATLHLDTTYCGPEHRFPLQRAVVAEVVRLCREAVSHAAAAGRAPPLFVFGSYTIGKERLFLEVGVQLGLKIFLESDKWQVMQCLDMRLGERRLLTRNINEAGIHVVPMRRIRMDRLKEQLRAHGGFSSLLAFKPTGWTFSPERAGRAAPAAAGKTPLQPGPAPIAMAAGIPAAGTEAELRMMGGMHASPCVDPMAMAPPAVGLAGEEDAGEEGDVGEEGGVSDGGDSEVAEDNEGDDGDEASSDDCEIVSSPQHPVSAGARTMVQPPLANGGCPFIHGACPGSNADGGYPLAPARRNAHDVLMRAQKGHRVGDGVALQHDVPNGGTAENAFQRMMRASGECGKQPHGNEKGHAVRGGALRDCAPWVKCRASGAVRLVEVPYSEHSSIEELREFVAWLRPRAVVPTVGGGREATPRMLRLLAGPAV